MPKDYRTYLPEQELLLPPSLREWLPENHLVYFVSDVVDQLDLSAIHAVYEKEKRGQPPYDPRLMTKLLVYGYCTGTPSGRDAGSARAVLQSTICCWWRQPGLPANGNKDNLRVQKSTRKATSETSLLSVLMNIGDVQQMCNKVSPRWVGRRALRPTSPAARIRLRR